MPESPRALPSPSVLPKLFVASGLLAAAVLGTTERAVARGDRIGPMAPPGFALSVGGVVTSHPVFAASVMPGESLPLSVVDPMGPDAYWLSAAHGTFETEGPGAWRWNAPAAPGTYRLEVADASRGTAMALNVFVLRPASEMEGARLKGYRIGSYPEIPSATDARTVPPEGFIEVGPEDLDTLVSPNFRLGQFLCKQDGDFPKYVLVDPALVVKLEAILESLRLAGFGAETLHVMSGYRTPAYNAAIRNVRYSQHQWGRAADVFVDMDGDSWMDDLNGDGVSNVADAEYLRSLVLEMQQEPWYEPLVGGLGLYHEASHRPAFIHVDTRGRPARW